MGEYRKNNEKKALGKWETRFTNYCCWSKNPKNASGRRRSLPEGHRRAVRQGPVERAPGRAGRSHRSCRAAEESNKWRYQSAEMSQVADHHITIRAEGAPKTESTRREPATTFPPPLPKINTRTTAKRLLKCEFRQQCSRGCASLSCGGDNPRPVARWDGSRRGHRSEIRVLWGD